MYAYMPAAMSAIDGPALEGSSSVPVTDRKPGFALDQQVVGFFVAIRTRVAVAGNVADDDARASSPRKLA